MSLANVATMATTIVNATVTSYIDNLLRSDLLFTQRLQQCIGQPR